MKFFQQLDIIKSNPLRFRGVYTFHQKVYAVESNHQEVIDTLDHYFSEWKAEEHTQADTTVIAWDDQLLDFELDFQEYKEVGKKRIKELYADLQGYRVIKKTKTGVQFAVGTTQSEWFAFGPLVTYSNQLINFINAIFMEEHLSESAYLFHAAAVAQNGTGIVIAAQSGKGKSTTALNLLNKGLNFVSNDRVILQKEADGFTMIGVPKHPRVNPGTLLNNPKVTHILKEPQRFEGLSQQEIWNWEEKYDVLIPEIYGAGKFPLAAQAMAFLIIDWEPNNEPLELVKTDLSTRPDLLPAIMKVPSLMTPKIHQAKKDLTEQQYLDFIGAFPVYILQGGMDAKKGVVLIQEKFFPK